MSISKEIINSMEKSSWIRKMFETGAELKAKFGAENVFDFSLGNPDVEPPKEFFTEMEKLIKEHPKGIHGYMSNAGFENVRNNIAEKVARDHGVKVGPENIVMTCGAAGGLNTIFKTILNPGEQVIVPKPYFVEYGFYVNNHKGELVLVDTKEDFSLDIENINNAINEKTKAVLINSPNNPTGKIYSEKEIQALARLLDEYSSKGQTIFLISDEPYREIVYDDVNVPGILEQYNQSIVVTSYSKSLSLPGERIGFIATNPKCKDINLLMNGLILSNRILGFVNAPALMQRVVARLNEVSVKVEIYKARRDLFVEGLKSAGYEFINPEGAFYIFCKSPIEDDVKFVRHLQKYNVLVVPGKGFGGPGYFRISYCISEDIIRKALPKFKQALEEL